MVVCLRCPTRWPGAITIVVTLIIIRMLQETMGLHRNIVSHLHGFLRVGPARLRNYLKLSFNSWLKFLLTIRPSGSDFDLRWSTHTLTLLRRKDANTLLSGDRQDFRNQQRDLKKKGNEQSKLHFSNVLVFHWLQRILTWFFSPAKLKYTLKPPSLSPGGGILKRKPRDIKGGNPRKFHLPPSTDLDFLTV